MFSIIYSVRHKDCGELTFLSDYRVMSRDALKLYPEIKPLKMHCCKCYLELEATHFEVVESEGLGVKNTIEVTTIEQFDEIFKRLTNSKTISNLQS